MSRYLVQFIVKGTQKVVHSLSVDMSVSDIKKEARPMLIKHDNVDLVIIDNTTKRKGRFALVSGNRIVKIKQPTIYYKLPLGNDGYVLSSVLKNRSEKRSARAIEQDNKANAKRIYPSKMTSEQAQSWYRHPNQSDIEGIDTKRKANYKFKKPIVRRPGEKAVKKSRRITADEYHRLMDRDGIDLKSVSDGDWKDILIPYIEDSGIQDFTKARNKPWRRSKRTAIKYYMMIKNRERGRS